MSAVLRVAGLDFEIDRLLAQLDFSPYLIRRRGELNFSGRPHEFSSFNAEVSGADMQAAEQQIMDALAFMQRHEAALLVLSEFPGVDDRTLDFGIEERDVAHHVDSFPYELLAALGRFRINLDVSRYPRTPEDGTPA
ncbi:hypothetical protein V3W47_07560 [Deinococcus sp. YIM 134068]|uniref:hypothetical protein n=1 Tax=Deinococcus lichenicola TaxID=3118910 RepID=UPI002F937600